VPRGFRCEPLLRLGNHLQHLPSGSAVPCESILTSPVLEGFFDRDLPRFSVLRDGEGTIDYHVKADCEGRALDLGRPFGLPLFPLRNRLSAVGRPGPTLPLTRCYSDQRVRACRRSS
jgi:hypothetical protein